MQENILVKGAAFLFVVSHSQFTENSGSVSINICHSGIASNISDLQFEIQFVINYIEEYSNQIFRLFKNFFLKIEAGMVWHAARVTV